MFRGKNCKFSCFNWWKVHKMWLMWQKSTNEKIDYFWQSKENRLNYYKYFNVQVSLNNLRASTFRRNLLSITTIITFSHGYIVVGFIIATYLLIHLTNIEFCRGKINHIAWFCTLVLFLNHTLSIWRKWTSDVPSLSQPCLLRGLLWRKIYTVLPSDNLQMCPRNIQDKYFRCWW